MTSIQVAFVILVLERFEILDHCIHLSTNRHKVKLPSLLQLLHQSQLQQISAYWTLQSERVRFANWFECYRRRPKQTRESLRPKTIERCRSMLVYRRLNMSEQFFVNSQYMNKSFSSCLPFSSPSLNNSSEIVAKRVAFSFEGLEETFGRSKKQAVFSAHDICLEVVRQRASRNPHRRGLLDLIVYNTFQWTNYKNNMVVVYKC